MGLWHKDLIEKLPREQLVAQWRECSAIAGNLITKGTPNHILVNKILNYAVVIKKSGRRNQIWIELEA